MVFQALFVCLQVIHIVTWSKTNFYKVTIPIEPAVAIFTTLVFAFLSLLLFVETVADFCGFKSYNMQQPMYFQQPVATNYAAYAPSYTVIIKRNPMRRITITIQIRRQQLQVLLLFKEAIVCFKTAL